MRFISSTVVLAAICGLAVAGHHDYGHGHGGHGGGGHAEEVSYSVATKHEHSGHGGGGHSADHHSTHEWVSEGGHDAGHYGGHDAGHYGGHEAVHYGGHDEGHDGGHDGGHDDGHDYHAHPKYEFDYGVKDLKTGDIKDQKESRDGDKVKGSYTFKEADGTTRHVEYSSDKKKGFTAVVHKLGHADAGHGHGHGHGHHDDGHHDGHHGGHASSYVNVKKHEETKH